MDRPDLVIFDIDGTLQDTCSWWPRVLRAGLIRFQEQCGLDLPSPSDDEANAVIGCKNEGVWAPFVPGHEDLWSDLRAVVLPMEVDAMTAGGDTLFAGARDLLRQLRGRGANLALASNCHSTYLAGVCRGQNLDELTDHQFCLDSPGVACKADMLRLAIEATGARKAVMVGDRNNDAEAAAVAGIPFVWRVNEHATMSGDPIRWDGGTAELLEILQFA